jgi:hypothetical protein
VAGYNPLNEPTDEEHTRVLDWYARAEKAIHAVDPDHIVSGTFRDTLRGVDRPSSFSGTGIHLL